MNLLSDALKALKDTLKKTSAEKYIDNTDRPKDLTNEKTKNQFFEEQKAKYFPEINRAFESVKQVIVDEGDEFTGNLTIEDAKKQADFENKLLLNQMEKQREKLLKNFE